MVSLDAIFAPRSIAVIGASDREGGVARAVMENLREFPGRIYLVNPRRSEMGGEKVWPSLRAIGEPVDLAVIITPAATVPGLVAECVAAGVGGVIVISAGFRETGAAGAALEAQILAEVRKNGLRLIGPNCLGVMRPHVGLNATFGTRMAGAGRVAFLSQSGALCTAMLDLSVRENVGLSALVSVGSMLDVGWGDLIRYFGDDPRTASLVLYMESVGEASAFVAAAREVAARKPIVVIKVGRTEEASRAAASHTGGMTGSDAVFDAVLKQIGVLRVETIEELFDMAEVLAKQPLPRGPRLGVVTNAGGPGSLAVDALVVRGGVVAELGTETLGRLDALLPAHWSHGNPVDVLGDAQAGRFAAALRAVAADEAVDGLLAVLTPQSMTDPTAVAREVVRLAHGLDKPLFCSWMGGRSVHEGRRLLNEAGLATYDYPDGAARAFVLMWERRRRLEWLEAARSAETTEASEAAQTAARWPEAALAVVAEARAAGRCLLSEVESKALVGAFGIPVVETRLALTEDEAVARADEIGYPVVLKLHSHTVSHKSDVGGVRLDLGTAEDVRRAWRLMAAAVPAADFGGASVQRMLVVDDGVEVILGASVDPQFGPVLLFGAGGTWVEVLQDRVLALPPLTRAMARRWMDGARVHRILSGVRGRRPVAMEALAEVVVRLGELMLAEGLIVEIDLNPVVAWPGGVLVLDARVVVRPLLESSECGRQGA